MSVVFYIADYTKPADAEKVVGLLDAYAQDPMGGGEPLGDYARENLAQALHDTPGAFSVIGELDGKPVALANCFHGLSTFACRPLVNIHDLAVVGDERGRGLVKVCWRQWRRTRVSHAVVKSRLKYSPATLQHSRPTKNLDLCLTK